MILNALVDCYDMLRERGEVPGRGYSQAKVSFELNISKYGEVLNVIPLVDKEQVGKKIVEKPKTLDVPEQGTRASGIAPNFLCDNSSYILGIDNKGKPKRTKECFEASKQLVKRVLVEEKDNQIQALLNYYENWNPDEAQEHLVIREYLEKLLAGGNIVFSVEGEPLLDNEKINQAWCKFHEEKEVEDEMQCLITGKKSPIARLHPNIKGVFGAQTAGASLVSFNADAYDSYGHKSGDNAPTSEEAVFAYTTALNYLVKNQEYNQRVGEMTVVFWANSPQKEPQIFFSMSLSDFTEDENKQELLKSVFSKVSKGQAIDEIDLRTEFYVLGISPNAARLSIRFFIKSSFGDILMNMYNHQERLKIVGSRFAHTSFHHLLRETVNMNSTDKSPSPLMAGAMLRAVIRGETYPASFYQALMLRVKAERDITSGKAAGIKAYLLNNREYKANKEVLQVKVNEDTKEKAYVLGRLFAVLERAQEDANPGINSTIKDRYFTSACTNPGIVFPRLIQLAGYHNAKSDYGKAREYEIGKIMSKLDVENNPFPTQLSLKDQGIFMLGYYQQREQRFKKKEESKDA